MANKNNELKDLTNDEFFACIRRVSQKEAVKKFRDAEKQKTRIMRKTYLGV